MFQLIKKNRNNKKFNFLKPKHNVEDKLEEKSAGEHKVDAVTQVQ
jgi:hypothetical protein